MIWLSYKLELLFLAKKGHFHNGNFGAPNKRKLLQKKELICKEKEIYGLVIKKTNVVNVI